ncbi:hypothetical protein EDB83DRAFT_2512413 [Lactarius deliciosus]|nr:hypothetical protein EDB83DRAFT_2512413 [Lactarius deliciosus]
MISDLLQASSDGDLNKLNHLLAQPSSLDIEQKGTSFCPSLPLTPPFCPTSPSHLLFVPSYAPLIRLYLLLVKTRTGVTPLIAAVKNGHRDVVKALLDHGANPAHPSTHGLPEQYTSDASIVELLRTAALPKVNTDTPPQDPRFIHDPNMGPPKAYYLPHPGHYAYYPGMPVQPLPEDDQSAASAGSNVSNLPPPEIARFIPCRYFPACRYGASCIFAHPQGPYYPGPMPPPAQYPSPYDQPPYPPNFYPMPPPPPQFQPQNGVPPPHHLSPVSPQSATQSIPPPHPFVHQRNTSEIVPPVQIPFNPSGAPVPPPGPYGPMSPVSPSYPHHSQLSVPLTVPPPPPAHASPPGPQSPTASYPQPVAHPRFPTGPEQNGAQKSPPQEGFNPRGDRRTSGGPGFRRPSFGGGRKPPCLFFPSGRCRNGDECRFPHVAADGHVVGRVGRFRSPPQSALNGNGQANLEEKLANLSITEVSRMAIMSHVKEVAEARHRLSAVLVVPTARMRDRRNRRRSLRSKRVPNADEFPVLGGSSTPPQANGHGTHNGPTAAQVLQAAAVRKEVLKSDSVIEGQEQFRPVPSQVIKTDATILTPVPAPALSHKLPVTFAAVANGAPDTSKEVSVSA